MFEKPTATFAFHFGTIHLTANEETAEPISTLRPVQQDQNRSPSVPEQPHIQL